MVTEILLRRSHLITKETMENYCLENGLGIDWEDSVNDDIESLLEEIQNGKKSADAVRTYVRTYFLPKLTQEELKMVERKHENFMETFAMLAEDVDVNEEEMKASESDSKYVYAEGIRITITIENSLKRKISI